MPSFFKADEQVDVQQKRPSRSAQNRLEEEEASKDPNGRKRGRKAAAVADVVVRLEIQHNVEQGEKVVRQCDPQISIPKESYVFVDEDSVGDVQSPPVKLPVVVVNRREKKVGKVAKAPDDFIVNNGGKWLLAVNGRVQINLAKFILVRVTEETIADCAKRKVVDYEKSPIGAEHYQCLLDGGSAHQEFIKVGKNTGNLKKHCEAHHELQIASIERLVAETPKEETAVKVREFILGINVPSTDLRKHFVRRDRTSETQEISCFVWFLDAQLPFTQFDCPLFENILTTMGFQFAGSKTLVESLLPFVYSFAISQQVQFLKKCVAFTTSYDGWSRFGNKFVSQNYHCIEPSTFEFRIMCLDLIPLSVEHYSEVIAGCLRYRQDQWTAGSKVIAAIGVSDSAANMRAASRMLYEDFERCQNHRLKKIYEEGEKESGQYLKDFNCIAELCQFVGGNGNAADVLRVFQHTHTLSELSVVMFNATRWEGRFLTVKRFYELRESLVALEQLPLVVELRGNVPDFLKGPFFGRLKHYLFFLTEMNDVSLLYQSQKFPTGCLVPLSVHYLQKLFQPQIDAVVPKYLFDFKSSFLRAVEKIFVAAILGQSNNFLKAALFHPGIGKYLPTFVSEEVLADCWDAVEVDIGTISKERDFTDIALKKYRIWLQDNVPMPMPDIVIAHLKIGGSFAGIDPLAFWKEIANDRTNANVFGGSFLLPVASMVLALPAGESVDEFTFSSTQRTLTVDRNSLSPTHLEQMTIVRMFIRNFGWSPKDLAVWLEKARHDFEEQETMRKKLAAEVKAAAEMN